MEKIAFIGTGVMGRHMARHLMDAGYGLRVYNRTKAKARELIQAGALWREDIARCVSDADIIITMVGYPEDVQQVYLQPGGIIQNAKPHAVLIDMTTTRPALAEEIYEAAAQKQQSFLDAPVSGGDTGARNAALTIMVGGDASVFEYCMPIFKALGNNINHMGSAGCGQHAKMCNQIALAGALTGVCEAMAYARSAGLEPKNVLDAISGGAAGSWQMQNNGYKMIDNDFEPGFYMKHLLKDLGIALDEARRLEFKLPVLAAAHDICEELCDGGCGDMGTQAMIKWYSDEKK